MLVAVLAGFGLIAGACGDKKDEGDTAPSGTEAEAVTETTVGGVTTRAAGTQSTGHGAFLITRSISDPKT